MPLAKEDMHEKNIGGKSNNSESVLGIVIPKTRKERNGVMEKVKVYMIKRITYRRTEHN